MRAAARGSLLTWSHGLETLSTLRVASRTARRCAAKAGAPRQCSRRARMKALLHAARQTTHASREGWAPHELLVESVATAPHAIADLPGSWPGSPCSSRAGSTLVKPRLAPSHGALRVAADG